MLKAMSTLTDAIIGCENRKPKQLLVKSEDSNIVAFSNVRSLVL